VATTKLHKNSVGRIKYKNSAYKYWQSNAKNVKSRTVMYEATSATATHNYDRESAARGGTRLVKRCSTTICGGKNFLMEVLGLMPFRTTVQRITTCTLCFEAQNHQARPSTAPRSRGGGPPTRAFIASSCCWEGAGFCIMRQAATTLPPFTHRAAKPLLFLVI